MVGFALLRDLLGAWTKCTEDEGERNMSLETREPHNQPLRQLLAGVDLPRIFGLHTISRTGVLR